MAQDNQEGGFHFRARSNDTINVYDFILQVAFFLGIVAALRLLYVFSNLTIS